MPEIHAKEHGGLLSYRNDLVDDFGRAANYADRILLRILGTGSRSNPLLQSRYDPLTYPDRGLITVIGGL